MKKTISIINVVLSALILLLAYIPECIRNTGYYIGYTWYDGYDYTYGLYMDEFGWVMVAALILLVLLSFTKYYFVNIAPAVTTLFVIVYVYLDAQNVINIRIRSSLIVILIIIAAICLVLNSIWAIIDNISESSKNGKTFSTIIKSKIVQSDADELKKFKDLFDNGVITQEEFDTKKEQLLGRKNSNRSYFCPNCNNTILFEESYCKNCGQKFDWNKQ